MTAAVKTAPNETLMSPMRKPKATLRSVSLQIGGRDLQRPDDQDQRRHDQEQADDAGEQARDQAEPARIDPEIDGDGAAARGIGAEPLDQRGMGEHEQKIEHAQHGDGRTGAAWPTKAAKPA